MSHREARQPPNVTAAGPEPVGPASMRVRRSLTVGRADDPAERAADQMAEAALASLGSFDEAPLSTISRESTSVGASAAADPLGGTQVSPAVQREIAASRGAGKPLGRREVTAFSGAYGADLSSVRVHTDDRADRLSRSLQANAFTTGRDVFFRSGTYKPGTDSGDRLIGHELAHVATDGGVARRSPKRSDAGSTEQWSAHQSGQVRRSAEIIRRWDWPWAKKAKVNPEPDPREAAAKANAKAVADKQQAEAWAGKKQNAVAGGHIGEAVKPIGVLSTAGGLAAGMQFGGSGTGVHMNSTQTGLETGLNGAAGASGLLGLVDTGLAAKGLYDGYDKASEGDKYDDAAMKKMGMNQMKANAMALGKGAVGISQAGIGIGTMAGGVAVGSAAATAGVGLGIVAGGAAVLQGSWRGGKAVMKLCRLTFGRGAKMLTADGERWKSRIRWAEGFKVAVNALKVAAGALGIAAGVLLLASNPVGWAIGLAAALAGAAIAIPKLVGKFSNAKDRSAAKDKVAPAQEEAKKAAANRDNQEYAAAASGRSAPVPRAVPLAGAPRLTPKPPEGRTPSEQRDIKARQQAIDDANEIAREGSENATIAGEMRAALFGGNKDFVAQILELQEQKKLKAEDRIVLGPDKLLHDALVLLSAVNIDYDEATAASGQELIEKKMSKVEAM